MHLMA